MVIEINKKSVGIVVAAIFILLLVFVTVKRQKTAVVFNIKSTYTAFLKQASSHKLPKEEIVELGRAFPKAVTMAVHSYAKSHNVVIFTQNAVIAGAKDVTKDIQALIGQNMKNLTKAAGKNV